MCARRRKGINRWVLRFFLLSALGVGAYFFFKWLAYREAKFTTYPEFGINIPNEYEIHGIDVARYQHVIAWDQVQEMEVGGIRLGFAFIKATEGIGNTDPQFRRNWRKSQDAGVTRGAYHFFIASRDGKRQAENFIRRVELEPGDLPPVLDVEQRNGVSRERLQQEVNKWLATVEAYYKVKPIIYTNVDFYNQNLGSAYDAYPLWVAHYYQAQKPRISRSWSFWQHSDKGNVNGITSKVDFNVFRGDSTDFRDLLFQ